MVSILRAFAWLRWRTFINSLERTGSRDMLERFSLAIEKLGPVLAAIMLIPSGLALATLGAASGYALAQGNVDSLLAMAPRFALGVVPFLALVGPVLLPTADRTNPVRMLLLPIDRRTLYVAQSAAALGDLWVLLMLPLVGFIPVGLLAGGAFSAAAIASVAGLVLVLVVVAVSSTMTSLLHLVVRDRRRGEVLALLFLLVVPMVGMLPSLASNRSHLGTRAESPVAQAPRPMAPEWVAASAKRAFSAYPSELYGDATRGGAAHDRAAAVRGIAGLTAMALLLNALGAYVFGKVLNSPGAARSRSKAPTRPTSMVTLPWVSSGASAVALAQVRLALRTPRGRAIMFSPVVMAFVYAVINRHDAAGMNLPAGLTVDTGFAIACFGSFICSLTVLPIALNQFAIDKAGLTRALLSPLSDGDYLTGKAAGNALIAAVPSVICFVGAYLLLPGTRTPTTWAGIPVALLSVYCLVAPAAAILSATFPRVVDMNSIGRASNAHGLAALLGMLSFVAAAVLTGAIAAAASYWFRRGPATLMILLVWCGLCFVFARLLFMPAQRVFARRRENLAML